MKTIRLLLHSFALTLINLAAILLGFAIYTLLRPAPQIAIQAPAAAIITIVSFFLWALLIKPACHGHLFPQNTSELIGTWLLALLWSPTLFVPLHYLGRGYVTSLANIWNLWLFQMPINALALCMVWKMLKKEKDSRT